MPPKGTITIDLEALIAHAERFGRFRLSPIECAMLDGIVEAYVNMYLCWHRRVWR